MLALALTLLSVHADRPAVSPTGLALLTVSRAENAAGCEALPVKINWFGSAAADTEEETEAWSVHSGCSFNVSALVAALIRPGAANASAASEACPANADWLSLRAVLTAVLAELSWSEAEALSAEVDLVSAEVDLMYFLALPAWRAEEPTAGLAALCALSTSAAATAASTVALVFVEAVGGHAASAANALPVESALHAECASGDGTALLALRPASTSQMSGVFGEDTGWLGCRAFWRVLVLLLWRLPVLAWKLSACLLVQFLSVSAPRPVVAMVLLLLLFEGPISASVLIRGELYVPTGFDKACCVMLRLLGVAIPKLLPRGAVCLLSREQRKGGESGSGLTFGFSTLNGCR